jgi:hypothetical protein
MIDHQKIESLIVGLLSASHHRLPSGYGNNSEMTADVTAMKPKG